jgi:hypothetical protein
MRDATDMAEEAAEMIGRMLVMLHQQSGIPMDCVLAGAHSQVIAMMTASVGGPMTALCCEQAAERVRDWPSLGAASLAFARPSGTA